MSGLAEQASVASTSARAGDSSDNSSIAIRLTTKDAAYAIPSNKFFVPGNWRRYHLSELINKVLNNSQESTIPFDFVINEALLRTALEDYCKQTNTSTEETIEIEYFPSTQPPKLEKSSETDDWISEVVIDGSTTLISSYAGTVECKSATGSYKVQHDLSALSACVTDKYLVTGGMDRVVKVWEGETPVYDYILHQQPVSSVRKAAHNANLIVTASWDGLVSVFDLTAGVNEEAARAGQPKSKKRRTAEGEASITASTVKTPSVVLHGHSGKVSRAIFDRSSDDKVFSSGVDDHSVYEWDVPSSSVVNVKTHLSKSILDLTQLAASNLLATASIDRTVSLWDMRTDSIENVATTLIGHTAPVSSVAAHPVNSLLLASGSYDGTVRIWDARSPKQALFILNQPENDKSKILSIAWNGEKLIAGGESKKAVEWSTSTI